MARKPYLAGRVPVGHAVSDEVQRSLDRGTGGRGVDRLVRDLGGSAGGGEEKARSRSLMKISNRAGAFTC